MSRPDQPAPDAIERITVQLGALQSSIDAMAAKLDARLQDLVQAQARLEQSEAARRDLLAQTEHLLELLDKSRHDLRALRRKRSPGGT